MLSHAKGFERGGAEMSVKVMVARAQLGTALDLFIRDRDPIAVHALACGGSEIVEGLAKHGDIPSVSTHILKTLPSIDYRKVKDLRNQFWNAFKHFHAPDRKTVRDDDALIADFTDAANDAVLFMGWLDYLMLTKRLPLEAQIFLAWWYDTNPQRMVGGEGVHIFPGIDKQPRWEQKRRLRRAVEKWRNNRKLLEDPRTERGPLSPRVDNHSEKSG